MAAINSDPAVTEFLSAPTDPASVAAFVDRQREHWTRHGFGVWAAESREPDRAGRLLGFVGLAHPGFVPEMAHRVEVGWRLTRDAWGRGLATEGALRSVRHAWEVLDLDELISVIHARNERSRRVAAKLGMRVERTLPHPTAGHLVEIHVLRR